MAIFNNMKEQVASRLVTLTIEVDRLRSERKELKEKMNDYQKQIDKIDEKMQKNRAMRDKFRKDYDGLKAEQQEKETTLQHTEYQEWVKRKNSVGESVFFYIKEMIMLEKEKKELEREWDSCKKKMDEIDKELVEKEAPKNELHELYVDL